MVSILIVVLLLIAVVFYVGYPLIFRREGSSPTEDSASPDQHPLRELLHKKEITYLALKDLEFDYKMGKLSEGDYHQLREQLKRDAIVILQQIDEMEVGQRGESLEDQIEREILAFRKKKKAGLQTHPEEATPGVQCPHCHKRLSARDKFCSECGTRVQFSCESCGQVYPTVHKFCPNCGNKLVFSL